jgi:hypothetical protein
MTLLGSRTVGAARDDASGSDKVDPAPLVLWAGQQPAAVLYLRTEIAPSPSQDGFKITQRLEAAEPHLGDPFPLIASATLDPERGKAEELDLVDARRLVAADVDGDGTDEAIVVRNLGAVEVLSTRKVLHRLAPLGSPATATFRPVNVHRARAGGADVVYVVLERQGNPALDEGALAKAGFADRSAVLCIDRRGITRLRLGADRVLAIGAVSRPGSQVIDELVAVNVPDEGGDLTLSRHAPSGAPLGAPRKVYVPISPSPALEFRFQPESRETVLVDRQGGQAYFVEAEKPVNWVRAVDLSKVAGKAPLPQLLGALGRPGDAQLLVASAERLYAIDRDGQTRSSLTGGAPQAPPGPFRVAVAPGPEDAFVGYFAADGDGSAVVAVHTRPTQVRRPSHEDCRAAAERYLAPPLLAQLSAGLEPSLEELASYGRIYAADVERERLRRAVTAPLQSAAEWRRLLPDAHAAVAELNLRNYDSGVLMWARLATDDDFASDPDEFRDAAGMRGWLEALELPARTTLTVLRDGATLGAAVLPGELPRELRSELMRPVVAFRVQGDELTAVLPLRAPRPSRADPGEGDPSAAPAHFTRVQARLGGR